VAASTAPAREPIVGRSAPLPSASGHRSTGPGAGAVPLHVKRLVLARSIAAREPVDVASSFSTGEIDRIYAFVEIDNPARSESDIIVTFEPEHGSATGHVRLQIGAAPRWRTWAYTRAARQPGAWAAVVRDEQGTELARTAFELRSDAPVAPGASGSPAAPASPAQPTTGATGGSSAAAAR